MFKYFNNPNISYLESLSELVGHYVVQQGIHGGGKIIEDAAHVRQDLEGLDDSRRGRIAVYGQEALGMKWRPTNEKRHHYSN